MRININGVDVDEAEFIKRQEEARQQVLNTYKRLREVFDCNCAIVVPSQSVFGHIEFGVVCSIDKTQVPNAEFCKQCHAYNNTDYSKIG